MDENPEVPQLEDWHLPHRARVAPGIRQKFPPVKMLPPKRFPWEDTMKVMCLGDDDDYYCYYYHYDYVLLYTIVHECQNLHSFIFPKVMFMVLRESFLF